MEPRVAIDAGRELGAYGDDQEPWRRPSERLEAALSERGQRGLDRAAAPLGPGA